MRAALLRSQSVLDYYLWLLPSAVLCDYYPSLIITLLNRYPSSIITLLNRYPSSIISLLQFQPSPTITFNNYNFQWSNHKYSKIHSKFFRLGISSLPTTINTLNKMGRDIQLIHLGIVVGEKKRPCFKTRFQKRRFLTTTPMMSNTSQSMSYWGTTCCQESTTWAFLRSHYLLAICEVSSQKNPSIPSTSSFRIELLIIETDSYPSIVPQP